MCIRDRPYTGRASAGVQSQCRAAEPRPCKTKRASASAEALSTPLYRRKALSYAQAAYGTCGSCLPYAVLLCVSPPEYQRPKAKGLSIRGSSRFPAPAHLYRPASQLPQFLQLFQLHAGRLPPCSAIIPAARPAPVSYTHLDVYKRQPSHSPQRPKEAGLTVP